MFMNRQKRATSIVLVLLLVIQYTLSLTVSAAEYASQPAPEKLRVEAIYDDPANEQPAIGYNEYDKYYVDLKSDKITRPQNVSAPRIYINYYLQEVTKPYKPVKSTILKEADVPAKTDTDNEIRLKELNSGTVYYAYSRAYYTYTTDKGTYTSSESLPSNTVKFMTDIEIKAYSYGPNQIKIEWDDVWVGSRRMDYKLYISENSTFANTPPIYISSDQISSSGPVTVNEASGKLEYIHTVRDPGRVYYIKIVPDTVDTELKRSSESRTVAVSSFILAKMTKMSVTSSGNTIWKMEWSPVVTGLNTSDIKVSYQIYRGSGTSGNLEQYMASKDDTTYYLTLGPGEDKYYYIIKAIVTRNGQNVYPGISITSSKIYVKESEVPSTPAAPELTNELSDGSSVIRQTVTATSATILWRAPLKGDGEVDSNVLYDIWLITDPNYIDDPPADSKIASDLEMSQSNYVMSGNILIGYKYTINNLVPNSTYYFKIIAKKNFIDYVDDVLQNVTLQSGAAVKTFITPALGPVDQPVVPGAPPLRIKNDKLGNDMVTSTSVVITLQNKWYEEYSNKKTTDSDPGEWSWYYRTPSEMDEAGMQLDPPVENLADKLEKGDESVNPLKFRKVEYDSGVTIDVGCIEYTPGMDYNELANLPADKVISYPVTPNDPDEDIGKKDSIRDGKRHNVDITLYDLEPNKTYVIWVRAARRGSDLISGPSEPIIVTTDPELPTIVEKPTVPVFNYNYAGDTFIDLGWNFNNEYVYYLEYGTEDDRSRASGSITITPEDLEFATYYRVEGLKPSTVYYFWIQAEKMNTAGEAKRSDFSDSYMVKTQKEMPPDTPLGFGVKGTSGSVTKNSITYEWIAEEGLDYILEISEHSNYAESKTYRISGASEFTVQDLRSNFRYYARLYAYDPEKDLSSAPTQSVTARTLRSTDEYDSSEDTEGVISGDFIIKDSVAVNGVWNIRITGVNADRFIQYVQTDNILDYRIDLSSMPSGTKTISAVISKKVFRALGMLGENLILKTVNNSLIIRPGVLADSGSAYGTNSDDTNYIIRITLNAGTSGDVSNLIFRTQVSELEISLSDGLTRKLESFGKPMKVEYEFSSAASYKAGTTFGYYLPSGKTAWQKSSVTRTYNADTGTITLAFEMPVPGRVAIADQGESFYTDISSSYARSAIVNVARRHELKSVTGRKFEPGKNLTIGDGVKFMLDIMDCKYDAGYMTTAAKAGIINAADIGRAAENCTREQLISMAVRVCELKTSERAGNDNTDLSMYKDISQVSPALLNRIRYAQRTGVITSRFSDMLGPKDSVTRAEAMVLIEKLLRYAGEL